MLIRLAQIQEADNIVSLLNETTLDLHHKGILQWTYPWNKEEIAQQIINSTVYVFLADEHIIGTFRIENTSSLFFRDSEIYYLSQIALSPASQGRNMGSAITEFACSYARTMNKALFLDCWAGNETLKAFYKRNGFEHIGDYPEEDYFISVFRFM
jgi:GNAT superfamily N-acetyltransferase